MKIKIPYKPREHQKKVHNKLKRFNVLVCHRRFGKTVLCINELLKKALQNPMPRPRYYYIAPTYSMAKRTSFDYLKEVLDNKEDYIGKEATIRFFQLTPDGIPRFPFAVGFRDYE